MFKKIICISIVLSLLMLQVSAMNNDSSQAVPTATQGMQVGANAAIVMEVKTGRVLFEQSPDERLPFASTTKIMTALITLEQPQTEAVFVVDPEAIKVQGSSMGLQEGDQSSLYNLAIGMLLSSGNDAANAAAVRISGSIPAFIDLMNLRAKQLGMLNTSFETPSGLDGEMHFSSARDLAILTQAALSNDQFRAICSQFKIRASYGNPPYDRWLTNHNKLLNYFEGTIGVKTGFTKKAGRCLVSAASRDGVELICVTLNCSDDWQTHENLYNKYFPTLQVEDLVRGLPPVQIPIAGGTTASIDAVCYDIAQVPVPVGGANIEYKIFNVQPFLYAPITAGQAVADCEIYLDSKLVSTLTLISPENVPLKFPYEEPFSFWKWIKNLVG